MDSPPPRRRSGFGLPLLFREMVERAARPRTYRQRVLCAIVVYAIALIFLAKHLPLGATTVFSVLGIGKAFFHDLFWLSQIAICLFVPGLTAGSLTIERERGTMELLLLTRLSPQTIVWEKLGSSLLVMLSLLLPILPLLALAYSLGGIPDSTLWSGVLLDGVMCLQLAALGLACSAWIRKTSLAITSAYGLSLLLLTAPTPLLAWLGGSIDVGATATTTPVRQFAITLAQMGILQMPEQGLFPTFPVMAVFGYLPVFSTELWRTALFCLPSLLLAGGLLQFARKGLLSPAWQRGGSASVARPRRPRSESVTPSRLAEWWNRVVTTPLPGDFPIAWRESRLARAGYWRQTLIKVTVVLLALVGLIILINRLNPVDVAFSYSGFLLICWGVLVVLIVLQSATAFAGERNQQTLQLLLTTPLSGEQIVREKWWGLRRLIGGSGIILISFALLNGQERWPGAILIWRRDLVSNPLVRYLVVWCLTVSVTMPTLAWLGIRIGLTRRAQGSAVGAALWQALAWLIALPLVFQTLATLELTLGLGNLALHDGMPRSVWNLLWLTTPGGLVAVNEFGSLEDLGAPPWLVVLLNTGLYCAIGLCLRHDCRRNADRYLDRLEAVNPHRKDLMLEGRGIAPVQQQA